MKTWENIATALRLEIIRLKEEQKRMAERIEKLEQKPRRGRPLKVK